MSTNSSRSYLDIVRWLIIISLISSGIIANYYYADINIAFRIIGWLLLAAMALVVGLQTVQGKQFLFLVREAKSEIQKVVWPNRQETFQTTLIVIVIVTLTALFLWGIDNLFLWLISLLR